MSIAELFRDVLLDLPPEERDAELARLEAMSRRQSALVRGESASPRQAADLPPAASPSCATPSRLKRVWAFLRGRTIRRKAPRR